jgi:hypothetical protein
MENNRDKEAREDAVEANSMLAIAQWINQQGNVDEVDDIMKGAAAVSERGPDSLDEQDIRS